MKSQNNNIQSQQNQNSYFEIPEVVSHRNTIISIDSSQDTQFGQNQKRFHSQKQKNDKSILNVQEMKQQQIQMNQNMRNKLSIMGLKNKYNINGNKLAKLNQSNSKFKLGNSQNKEYKVSQKTISEQITQVQHISKFTNRFVNSLKAEVRKNFQSDDAVFQEKYEEKLFQTRNVILQILKILNECSQNYQNLSQINEYFQQIQNLLKHLNLLYLSLTVNKYFGKIQFYFKDYLESVATLKDCKNMAQHFQFFDIKCSCYKFIGISMCQLKKYNIALTYFQKQMRVAWLMGDTNQEIKSYDFIGMCYYYLGKMDLAQIYHLKMVDGQIETDENRRQISTKKLQNRKYSNNPYNSLQQKKQKKVIIHDNIKDPILANQYLDDELISSSDDEFEVPTPNTNQFKKVNKDQYITDILERSSQAEINRIIQSQKPNKLEIGHIKYKDTSEPDKIRQMYEKITASKLNKNHKIRISHLSNTTNLNNFIPDYQQDFLHEQKKCNFQSVFVNSVDQLQNRKVLKKINKLKQNLQYLSTKLQMLDAQKKQLPKNINNKQVINNFNYQKNNKDISKQQTGERKRNAFMIKNLCQ